MLPHPLQNHQFEETLETIFQQNSMTVKWGHVLIEVSWKGEFSKSGDTVISEPRSPVSKGCTEGLQSSAISQQHQAYNHMDCETSSRN